MKTTSARYLVIDDDKLLQERLVKGLNARGATAFGADSIALGLELASRERPDRVILDLRLPDGEGIAALKNLQERLASDCKILILTGFGSVPTALSAVRGGAVNFLTKPATLEEILNGFEPEALKPASQTPTLDEVERDHIDRVLQAHAGNVTKAAESLGIHRRSLQRKLSKRS